LPLLTAEPIDATTPGSSRRNFFSDVRLLELDGVRRGHVDRGRLLEVRVADKSTGDDDVFAFGCCFLVAASWVVTPGA
jgi:hypothetical protein